MDQTLKIANIAYDIETYMISSRNNKYELTATDFPNFQKWAEQTGRYLIVPPNTEFLGAKYDPNTGTTVTLFRDVKTGEVKSGVTGTNFNAGVGEIGNDVGNWADIAYFGIGVNGPEVQFVLDYFKQVNIWPTEITGHSLGGCIAQIVGMRLQIDISVFNSAPLYSDMGNDVFGSAVAGSVYSNNSVELWERYEAEQDGREKNMRELQELIKGYKGKYINSITDSDILSLINKITNSKTIGDVSIVYDDHWVECGISLKDILFLVSGTSKSLFYNLVQRPVSSHLTSAFLKHLGMTIEQIETINLIGEYVKEGKIEIDVNGDGINDISYDEEDFKANNLFTNYKSGNNNPQIIVDEEGLMNLSENLGFIADGEIQEVLNVCDIALCLNDEIANKKNIRINRERENIKKFLEESILSGFLEKIREIINCIQQNNYNDLLIFNEIKNFVSKGDLYDETQFFYLTTLSNDYETITDNWARLYKEYNPDKQDNKLDVYMSKVEKVLNENLSIILEEVLKSLTDEQLNDVLVGMFSIEFNNLKTVSNYIADELRQLSYFSKKISQNFKNLDEQLSKSISEEYKFVEFENINKQENFVNYDPINNPHSELENHIDNGISLIDENIIKPINENLGGAKKELYHIDFFFAEMTIQLKNFVRKIKDDNIVTKQNVKNYLYNGKNTSIGKAFLSDQYEEIINNLEYDSRHVCLFNILSFEQQQLINNLEKIFTPYMNLCSLYHTMDLYIYKDNKLTTYIKSRIKELIYEETNFDEQIAALVIIANKFNTISEELNQARIAIEQCEGSCFDEMILYIEDVLANINYFIESVDSLTEQNVVIR